MTRAPLRLPTVLVAVALLALAGRARAQDDDDDLDKIPAPTSHHVVRPGQSAPAEAPSDDEEQPEHTAPPPAAKPAPEREEREEVAKPAKHPSHAKHEKKHKRAKKEKKTKHHAPAHHAAPESSEEPPPPAPAEPEQPAGPPRVIQASPQPNPEAESPADGEEGEPGPIERRTPAAESGQGEARRRAESPGDMDFNLLPQEKQASSGVAAVASKVRTRRSMLQWHQGFGIATAALMAATVISGQLNYSDRFGGGGGSGQYEIWHDTFEAATVVSFTAAGLLAIFAPSPFEHHSGGVDTVTIHKYSILVATIGMATEVPLGIWTATREGFTNQGTLALTHLVIGYVTAAAFTAGATALFF